jgi:hypothetical protein
MTDVYREVRASIDDDGEAWKPDHEDQMGCYKFGDEVIKLGMRHFAHIRAEDEAWSSRVHTGRTKFDPTVARYLRSRYEWWIKPCAAVLSGIAYFEGIARPVEGGDEFKKAYSLVRAILETPIESVIESMARIEKGEYEEL